MRDRARIGFGYQVSQFATIRGSYALIHTPLTGITNSVLPDLAPSALSIGTTQGGQNPNAWVNYVTNPVAIGTIPGVLTSGPLFSYITANSGATAGMLPYVNQSSATPYVQLWSLSMQFQLTSKASLEAAYSGQHGVRLFTSPHDTNVPDLNTLVSKIKAHPTSAPRASITPMGWAR